METANLTTVMKHYKITPTETYESIKLGIDAHAKWYYVARQLDGATPQPVQKMDFESSEVGDDGVPEIQADAVFNRLVEVDSPFDIGGRFRENDDVHFHRLVRCA